MRFSGFIAAILTVLGAVSASAADVDLICLHSGKFESIAHVKISGSTAHIRYVNLGDEKNNDLDYTYKAASDRTMEYELSKSDRYYYWYSFAGAQKHFTEPDSITLEGLKQSFFTAMARAEAYEKETNNLGFFAISGNMLVIDRANPTLYSMLQFRTESTGKEPVGENLERPCEIIEADQATDLMDTKLSDFKKIEAESIKVQEEGLKRKF